MSACVYVITHMPSGREYVGSARYGIAARWAAHVSSSKGMTRGSPLGRLIASDGPVAFSMVEIAQYDTVAEARIAEVQTMRSRSSFWPRGLNVTPDANSSYRKHLREERQRAFEIAMQRVRAASLHGLTTGDLSDEDNVRQADHELKRATTDAQLADWARRWGECAVERLHAVVTVEEEAQADAQEDIEAAEGAACELEREKGELEDKYFALRKAADAVFSALPMQPTDAELNALEALL